MRAFSDVGGVFASTLGASAETIKTTSKSRLGLGTFMTHLVAAQSVERTSNGEMRQVPMRMVATNVRTTRRHGPAWWVSKSRYPAPRA